MRARLFISIFYLFVLINNFGFQILHKALALLHFLLHAHELGVSLLSNLLSLAKFFLEARLIGVLKITHFTLNSVYLNFHQILQLLDIFLDLFNFPLQVHKFVMSLMDWLHLRSN